MPSTGSGCGSQRGGRFEDERGGEELLRVRVTVVGNGDDVADVDSRDGGATRCAVTRPAFAFVAALAPNWTSKTVAALAPETVYKLAEGLDRRAGGGDERVDECADGRGLGEIESDGISQQDTQDHQVDEGQHWLKQAGEPLLRHR
jgi:hypothetical protein